MKQRRTAEECPEPGR